MLHSFVVAALILQGAGNLQIANILIHNDGEAQGDRAGTSGDHHFIQRAEGVDEGGHAILRILQKTSQVAGLDVAENQRGPDGHCNRMDHRGHIVAQGHHAQLQAHLDTLLCSLLNAVADHQCQDALGLVIFDNLGYIFGFLRLAQDHGYTRDIACHQGDAQGTDDRIRHKADAGLSGVGLGTVQILQALNDLGTDSGSKAGVQGLSDIVLIGNKAFQNAHTSGQIPQSFDLYAGSGINRGEEISGVRESHRRVGAVLGDGVVDSALGQPGNGVGTGIDQISQCTHRLQPPYTRHHFFRMPLTKSNIPKFADFV